MKKRLGIFISGRGSNMKALLASCQDGVLQEVAEVVVVFSNKPTAAGLDTAAQAGIPTESLASKGIPRAVFDQKVIALMAPYNLDYIILAGYMRVLSPGFITAYPRQIINIHPADTTQHQGLRAYEWAWEQGLETTKITVHYVDEGLDTGAIIAQYPVDLKGAQSLEEVEKRGLAIEHQNYQQALYQILTSTSTQ